MTRAGRGAAGAVGAIIDHGSLPFPRSTPEPVCKSWFYRGNEACKVLGGEGLDGQAIPV